MALCPECGKVHRVQGTAYKCLSLVSNELTHEIIVNAFKSRENLFKDTPLRCRVKVMEEYCYNLPEGKKRFIKA